MNNTYVQIVSDNKVIAAASVDAKTGELVKNIWVYTEGMDLGEPVY